MLEKNLTPRVVIDGGFHKTGAIVEGDQSIEYIVTEFVRLRLLPFTLRHVVAFNKGEVYDDEVKMEEPDDFDKKPNDDTQAEQDQFTAHRLAENVTRREYFVGESEISSSRWSKFELSFFGSDQLLSKLSVSIHRSTKDLATVGGMKGINDIDLDVPSDFFCEIYLNEESFDEIVRLHINGNHKQLTLEVDLSGAPGFYSPWSPTIDEGRVVKYLDRIKDLENPEDLPPHFPSGRLQSRPFSISLVTVESDSSLVKETSADSTVEDLSYDDFSTEEEQVEPDVQSSISSADLWQIAQVGSNRIRNAIHISGALLALTVLFSLA